MAMIKRAFTVCGLISAGIAVGVGLTMSVETRQWSGQTPATVAKKTEPALWRAAHDFTYEGKPINPHLVHLFIPRFPWFDGSEPTVREVSLSFSTEAKEFNYYGDVYGARHYRVGGDIGYTCSDPTNYDFHYRVAGNLADGTTVVFVGSSWGSMSPLNYWNELMFFRFRRVRQGRGGLLMVVCGTLDIGGVRDVRVLPHGVFLKDWPKSRLMPGKPKTWSVFIPWPLKGQFRRADALFSEPSSDATQPAGARKRR